jgi:hypothetical protein
MGQVVLDPSRAEAYRKRFRQISGDPDPFRRKLEFLLMLDDYCRDTGATPAPVVVGGEAVELYTRGNHASHDIDILASKEALDGLLVKILGFANERHWYGCPEADIIVEWQGRVLDSGPDGQAMVRTIRSGGGSIRVIGYEDLIVDRLEAAKFSRHGESYGQARDILAGALEEGVFLDRGYLGRRARDADVSDILARLYGDAGEGAGEKAAGPRPGEA